MWSGASTGSSVQRGCYVSLHMVLSISWDVGEKHKQCGSGVYRNCARDEYESSQKEEGLLQSLITDPPTRIL